MYSDFDVLWLCVIFLSFLKKNKDWIIHFLRQYVISYISKNSTYHMSVWQLLTLELKSGHNELSMWNLCPCRSARLYPLWGFQLIFSHVIQKLFYKTFIKISISKWVYKQTTQQMTCSSYVTLNWLAIYFIPCAGEDEAPEKDDINAKGENEPPHKKNKKHRKHKSKKKKRRKKGEKESTSESCAESDPEPPPLPRPIRTTRSRSEELKLIYYYYYYCIVFKCSCFFFSTDSVFYGAALTSKCLSRWCFR